MDHRTRACAIANDLQYAPIGHATRMLVSALDDAHDEGAAVMAGIVALGTWAAECAAASRPCEHGIVDVHFVSFCGLCARGLR